MTASLASAPPRRLTLPAWLFRFSNLVIAAAVAALAALLWVSWPKTPSALPQPLPVGPGEAEIVWLQPAASTSGWERFVSAARLAADASPDLVVTIDQRTFPAQATAWPEFSVGVRGRPGRLVFRWYKITGDWKSEHWAEALLARRPPPLAVIGGDTSEPAIDLARALQEVSRRQAVAGRLAEEGRPLYCITTATADAVQPGTPLPDLYPGRTFRFCFTNRQMADSVLGFIFSQARLRPDLEPVYRVYWDDDPYSKDLTGRSEGGFNKALLDLAALPASRFPLTVLAPPLMIDSSVGTFDHPNESEASAANYLLAELARNPDQRRPLLLLSAQTTPSRRFLRALVRAAPTEAQRFVVGTGDSIAFNTVYRDRNTVWPIQDLPFPIVFFAHRDPVDPAAGFREATGQDGDLNRDGEAPEATSTDGVLLNRDIIETLVRAAWADGHLAPHADALRQGLTRAVWLPGGRVRVGELGPPLFDELGNRHNGTGEHVVCLLPVTVGMRVQPEATLEVWPVPPGWAPGQEWSGQATRILPVTYDGYTVKGGRP